MSKGNKISTTLRDTFWDDPFFSNNWDDFRSIHDSMMDSSKRFWESVNKDFPPSIEHQRSSNGESTSSSLSSMPNMMMPRRWMMPRFGKDFDDKFDNFFNDSKFPQDEGVIKLKNDADGLELSLDTHGYLPDELQVNVQDNMLSVEGKHEEKSEDGHKYVSKQFHRKYTLPDGCKSENVVSNLSKDGVLMVTAPKNNKAIDQA